jgi:hypothetical protein
MKVSAPLTHSENDLMEKFPAGRPTLAPSRSTLTQTFSFLSVRVHLQEPPKPVLSISLASFSRLHPHTKNSTQVGIGFGVGIKKTTGFLGPVAFDLSLGFDY